MKRRITIAALAVLVVGGGVLGYALYAKSNSSNQRAAATSNASPYSDKRQIVDSTTTPVAPERKLDDSSLSYSNEKYGFSFVYYKDWTVSEVAIQKPVEPMPTAFSVNLEHPGEDKHRAVAALEVIEKDYRSVVNYYDKDYQQSSLSKVTKTEVVENGKKVTHFTVITDTQPVATRTESFLYDLEGRTYVLHSINEEMNLQSDASYFDKFNNIHESLRFE